MRSAVLLLSAVGFALACSTPDALSMGRTNQIAATDFQFAPPSDTVTANQQISFMFPSTDGAVHNVTWTNPPPGVSASGSGDRTPGSLPYVVLVSQPGTYTYY